MPKISVIVPTYNRAHLVSQTIDSILAQTFEDFELIIVDNESTDNTEKVIRLYKDQRIRYFKNQNNGIVAVNRNLGIEKSMGKFIAFCDDDDLWMPDKLERQLAEFDQDRQVGMICSNGIEFHNEREYGNRIKTRLRDSDFTFTELVHAARIISSTVMIRKEVLDDVGHFDESPEIFTAEDYELWMRIAHKYKIKYIDSPLIKYRVHSGGYSPNQDYVKRLKIAEAAYQKLMEKGVLDPDLYHRGMRRIRLHIGMRRLLRYSWLIAFVEWNMRSLMQMKKRLNRKPKR